MLAASRIAFLALTFAFVSAGTSRAQDLLWASSAGGTAWDQGCDIASFPDGSSVVTGSFAATATFGAGEPNETTLTSAGSYDIFVARYNEDGTLAWARGAGGTASDDQLGFGIAAFPDGSSVVTGSFEISVTFGAGEPNETTLTAAATACPQANANGICPEIFVARYNADGTLAWARSDGGPRFDTAFGIAAFADGSSVVTGNFDGTATFGAGEPNETTLISGGNPDIFVARYNTDGTLAWAKSVVGTDFDRGMGIAAFADGSSVVTGLIKSTATFGAGEPNETILTSAGLTDLFVARYNSDGSLAWARSGGGIAHDRGFGIAAFADGSSVVTGFFVSTATFGAGEPNETILTSAGITDLFVARYNSDGSLAWARSDGGIDSDRGNGIAAFPNGSSMVAGLFNGTATFGAGEPNETILTSAGSRDIFVAGYNADATLAWARSAGGTGIDRGFGIAAFLDGSSVGTGIFEGTATFGAGEPNETILTSAGSFDIFVARYRSNLEGTSYCTPSIPNTTGFPGIITASGSPLVVDNDVTLTADQLPPSQFGYFLTSQTQGFFMPPGSTGFICLGGNIGRYNGNVGQGPTFSLQLDLTNMPVNPPVAVLPGDTWNFQAWYRDIGGTNNFTDAVEILFQ